MRASHVDQWPPLTQVPNAHKPSRFLIHVVVGRIVRQDELVRAQSGNRGDLLVDALGLGVVRDAERNGVVVGRGLEVAVLRRAEHAVPGAVGIERVDEVAFVGDQLRQTLAGGVAALALPLRLLRRGRPASSPARSIGPARRCR